MEFIFFFSNRSQSYVCPKCGVTNGEVLLQLSENSVAAQKEAKELGNQINLVKVCYLIN